jgi:hypothetical protein
MTFGEKRRSRSSHYTVSSCPLLLLLSSAQIPSSTTYSQTFSQYVPPSMSGTMCHTHLTRHQLLVFILSCLQCVHICYRRQKLEYIYTLHYKSEMVLHVESCLKLKMGDVQCWAVEGHKSVNSYHGIKIMLIKQPCHLQQSIIIDSLHIQELDDSYLGQLHKKNV